MFLTRATSSITNQLRSRLPFNNHFSSSRRDVGGRPSSLSFRNAFDLPRSPCRLDLGQSNIAYERMVTAVSRLSHDVSAIEQAADGGQKYVLHGTHLRHILLDSFSPASESTHSAPLQRADEVNYVSHETLDHGSRISKDSRSVFKEDMRIMSWAKRYMRPNPVRVEGDPYLPLNLSQVRAVATMIGEPMSLIQGVRYPAYALRI